MGLDIYHLKAVPDVVPSNEDQHRILYTDELPPEAFTDFGFDRYVRDVPDTELVHTVEFVADENTRRHAETRRKNEGSDPRTITYLIGSPDSHETDLRDVERRLGLARAQSVRYETKLSSPAGFSYSSSHVAYSKPILRKGIYTTEVGYQRKGMTAGFDDYFDALLPDYYVFVRAEDFRAVTRNIAPELPAPTRSAIHENFAESYEPGRSLLVISR